jgi:alpha-glucosidase
VEFASGVTADLTLVGAACNVYGNDIIDLVLSVQYQSKMRLSVKIFPKYISPNNYSNYILSPYLTPLPEQDIGSSNATSDLQFTWSNDPSFQFKVTRTRTGEVIFDTFGKIMVFEYQFLELVTSMVPDYNLYGLAKSITSFRHSKITTPRRYGMPTP